MILASSCCCLFVESQLDIECTSLSLLGDGDSEFVRDVVVSNNYNFSMSIWRRAWLVTRAEYEFETIHNVEKIRKNSIKLRVDTLRDESDAILCLRKLYKC